MDRFIPLQASEAALDALATNFQSFSPAEHDFEWLVGGVWLRTTSRVFLAAAETNVLPDGQVVRSLVIQHPDAMLEQVAREVPFINDRLQERGRSMKIERPPHQLLPVALKPWRADAYEMDIVVRSWRREGRNTRNACALLFTNSRGARLLVGTDVSSLAMVLSEDPNLIEAYLEGCALMSVPNYLSRSSPDAIPSIGN